MTRYTSPVNPAVFPHLTVVLLAIGMFFTAWFFVYPSLFTDLHFLIRKVLVNFSLKRCWYICILDSLSDMKWRPRSTREICTKSCWFLWWLRSSWASAFCSSYCGSAFMSDSECLHALQLCYNTVSFMRLKKKVITTFSSHNLDFFSGNSEFLSCSSELRDMNSQFWEEWSDKSDAVTFLIFYPMSESKIKNCEMKTEF